MPFFVYKITNKVNGKAYIGVTEKSVNERWRQHKSEARGTRIKYSLYRAMRKYGEDAFSIQLLYEATSRREMIAVERGLIAAHGTFGKIGYNLTSGGDGVSDRIVSDEFRRKMSAIVKGRVIGEEGRARMSAGIKAATSTPEGRAKQSAKMKGKKRSEAEKLLRSESIKKHWVIRRQRAKEKAAIADLLEVANVLPV